MEPDEAAEATQMAAQQYQQFAVGQRQGEQAAQIKALWDALQRMHERVKKLEERDLGLHYADAVPKP